MAIAVSSILCGLTFNGSGSVADGKVVSVNLSIESDAPDATTRENAGWTGCIVGMKSWTAEVTGLDDNATVAAAPSGGTDMTIIILILALVVGLALAALVLVRSRRKP